MTDHVYILLNNDKNGIVGYPDRSIVNKFAFDYYKGYYLNRPDFGRSRSCKAIKTNTGMDRNTSGRVVSKLGTMSES